VQFPILIGLRRSRLLDLAVLMAALLASASIFWFSGAQLIKVALIFATWALALVAWRNLRPNFHSIRLERSGHIFAARAGGADFSRVELEPLSTVHPWLTVIRLKTENGRGKMVIVSADSLLNADFRRLRMFLRWQAGFNELDDAA